MGMRLEPLCIQNPVELDFYAEKKMLSYIRAGIVQRLLKQGMNP
jgi:hypothetical protein